MEAEHIKVIELTDILKELPDIKLLDIEEKVFKKNSYVFLCALGFEDRCLNIPEKLAKKKTKAFKKSVYFDYSTSRSDNEINRKSLEIYLEALSDFSEKMNCCDEDFAYNLRAYLKKIISEYKEINEGAGKPKFIYDISVCSSQLILTSIRILIEFDIDLEILYTESEIYHPTEEEFEKESENWTKNEGIGHSSGVGKVISVYSGIKEESLDIVVAFPTFKPERTQAIIMAIDETIILKENRNRIIWAIGDPNMKLEEKEKRKEIISRINEINEDSIVYAVSTLNYKKTLEVLERIYSKKNLESHLNISALGSKMQSLGISIFSYIRPEITIYTALSEGYNPKLYSEGCKENWEIDLGDITLLRELLNKVGMFEVRSNQKSMLS